MTLEQGELLQLRSESGSERRTYIARMMDDEKEGGRAYGHWWWALASGAQLGLGVSSYRRGYAGNSCLMPLKAFVAASLFVDAAASTVISVLKASGIHKVEDLMEVGANIRAGLGVRPRTRDE